MWELLTRFAELEFDGEFVRRVLEIFGIGAPRERRDLQADVYERVLTRRKTPHVNDV